MTILGERIPHLGEAAFLFLGRGIYEEKILGD
jgi:hypothetical protein